MSSSHDLPPDVLEAASTLERHRPSLTDSELAGIKRRAAGRTRVAGGFTRSRAAITAALAAGVLMSGGGAALGVSALSTDLTASSAQYGGPGPEGTSGSGGPTDSGVAPGGVGSAPTQDTGGSDVLGQSTSGNGGANNGTGGVAGTPADNAPGAVGTPAENAPGAVAQAPRQVAASTAKSLPFTGYLAIPMLLGGLALLASGLVLRRRARA
jgi:hypothetical protein